ncbi:hypothetical protein PP714_11205 [Lacticaseibacillus paracasei]|nr:hypothetical protein [Lacticaseibacillus paracasei]
MKLQIHRLIYSLLYFLLHLMTADAATSGAIVDSLQGCNWADIETAQGATGRMFSVPPNQPALISSNGFYQGGYQTNSVIGSFNHQGALSFSLNGGTTNLFGVNMDTSHFLMEANGYFKGMS